MRRSKPTLADPHIEPDEAHGKHECGHCLEQMRTVWYFNIDCWYLMKNFEYCPKCNVVYDFN
jgi:hypothetical protein